jgi:hypothetical protein
MLLEGTGSRLPIVEVMMSALVIFLGSPDRDR